MLINSVELSPVDRKAEILNLLKAEGQASLAEIAAALHVSKQAAVRHLDALEGEGAVERAVEASHRPGRPEHVYRLTPAAAARFPQAHRQLASELLHFLPPKQLERFFSERAARLESEYAARVDGLDFEERVRELARLASEHGHMAQVVAQPDGSFAIRQCHCPIADVAAETGHPCHHEQAMYERLLGSEVTRTSYIPDADPFCTFVVPKPKEPIKESMKR
jgi:predicted ArsR family transcriptional regulator